MEEDTDKEARSAAQGLLDIAIKAARKGVDASGPRKEQSAAHEAEEGGLTDSSPARSAASRPVVPRPSSYMGSGRIITSGNTPPVIRPKEDSASGFKPPENRASERFQQPRPRKSEPQERVTLVVSRPQEEKEGNEGAAIEDDRKPSFDLPVPPSAFAIPGRPSAAETAITGQRTWESSQQGNDSESDNEDSRKHGGSWGQRPAKRPRMDRQVSINTVLQQVGSKDKLLNESIGRPPQTVQELLQWPQPAKRKPEPSAFSPVENTEAGQKLWGSALSSLKDSSLMPRNSSDRSTLDVHKQIAAQCSTETITNQPTAISFTAPPEATTEGAAPLGAATDLDPLIDQRTVQNAQSLIGSAVGLEDAKKAPLGSARPLGSPISLPTSQEVGGIAGGNAGGKEELETSLWAGQIKHRLKTAAGSSVAELFTLNALVPSKLLEQFPPTIYVNVITGRDNVKLGKHYVANCQLAKPTEKQLQMATKLVNMRLVAICELQNCTVTLVPYMTGEQGLRLVAFLIADE